MRLFYISLFCLTTISCNNKNPANPSKQSNSNLNEIIYNEMWHISNSGQKAYSNENAVLGIDLNLTEVKETGKSVKVLVTDSTIYFEHDDLINNKEANGSLDLTNSISKPSDTLLFIPNEESHATKVIGIIAANKNLINGFRGIAYEAKFGNTNLLSKYIPNYLNNNISLMKSYDFAKTNKYNIINQSYGSFAFSHPILEDNGIDIYNTIANKTKTETNPNGFMIVNSAGNATCDEKYADDYYNENSFFSPSELLRNMSEVKINSLNHFEYEYLKRIRSTLSSFSSDRSNPYVISVAGASANGNISYYSSIGSNLWITGLSGGQSSLLTDDDKLYFRLFNTPEIITTNVPGKPNLFSAKDFDKYDFLYPENKGYRYVASFNGTSAAAPTVSGVLALILEANPNLNLWEMKYILAKTANRTILKANPKPYCQKILEKMKIFDASNNLWEPWNKGWVKNNAGNYYHHAYGFGLVDAKKAIEMAKNFKYPYNGKTIQTAETKNTSLAIEINEGEMDESTEIEIKKDLIIQSVNITPVLKTLKADGLSIELISPQGTVSTILYPGNSIIMHNNISSDISKPYPLSNIADIENSVGFLSNAFYEESSKGKWKIRIKNGNLVYGTGLHLNKYKATLTGIKIKILGYE